jgi:hypothetical protein
MSKGRGKMDREEALRLADAEMQRAQETLEAQHAYEMEILKAIRQIYKPNRKDEVTTMSTERDTHFQGFARLLLTELQAEDYDISPTNDFAIEHIAKRAYDLAYHVLDNIWEVHNPEVLLERTPDLTEWPVEPTEGN